MASRLPDAPRRSQRRTNKRTSKGQIREQGERRETQKNQVLAESFSGRWKKRGSLYFLWRLLRQKPPAKSSSSSFDSRKARHRDTFDASGSVYQLNFILYSRNDFRDPAWSRSKATLSVGYDGTHSETADRSFCDSIRF